MKKTIISILSLVFLLSSCGEGSPSKPVLKEELPPAVKAESNLGILTMNKDGVTAEKKNERSELVKLLSIDSVDIAEVSWVWKSKTVLQNGQTYSDMPMKLSYDKRTKTFKEIYVQNNVIEEFKNIERECLIDYLKSGKTSYYGLEEFCNASYDFNNREMTCHAVGSKPDQDALTGKVKIVCDYVETIANDPSSIEYQEWSAVTAVGENWFVRSKFSCKNAMGVSITHNLGFFIQNSEVVRTTEIK